MNRGILRKLELLDSKRRKALTGRKGKKSGVSANINVTPLVDVVLVLLIIFMVVTPMLQGTIDLPKVIEPMAWDVSPDDIRVALDKNNKLTLNQVAIPIEALPMQLGREISRNPGRPVYLEADQNLTYGDVRHALEAIRDAGASQVGLGAMALKEEPAKE